MLRFKKVVGLLMMSSLFFLAACSGPEAKKLKFYSKGKELYEKGDYVKARLELKNALQIDPKFANAVFLSGMVDLKSGNLKGAFGALTKAVELDPGNLDAQYQLGKILLGVRQLDKAQEKAELILKRDPAHRDALLLKGSLLVARKEHEAARRFLEELIARGIKTPDAFLLLADACWEGGDLPGGESAVARGLEANPSSVDLILTRASLFARQNKADEAATLLSRACELEPKNLRHQINLAQFRFASGKEALGVEVLNRMIAAEPGSEDRRLAVAGFYRQNARPAEVEKVLKEGVERNPKSFPLRFALSEFYLGGSTPERGIDVLKECISFGKEGNPDVIRAKTILAKIHLQRGEIEKAQGYVDQVLKESPKNVDARFVKGSIHLLRREAGSAVTEFRTVVSEKPQFIGGYLKLAEANLLNKEPNLALDNLNSAQKVDPSSREVQIAFSRYYAIRKDFPSAREVLEKMLAKNPEDVEARVELGDLFSASGKDRDAEGVYAEVKRKAPTLPVGYVKSAVLYLKQGKKERAVAEYETAQKLNPGSWLIANDLAFLLAETSRTPKGLDRALELAEKARALNPDGINVLDTVGWVYYLKGNFPKAEELLREVQAKRPESPEANYHLGMALYKGGKLPEAKEKLTRSLSCKGSFPGKDEASRILAKI